MLNNAVAPRGRAEFTVVDQHEYNRSGPVRWIFSHLLRYKGFMASFAIAALLTNVLFSAIPRITGIAFDEVLKPAPSVSRLLWLALGVLAIVLVRGVIDLTNSFSIETLGQRLERDARQELYTSLLGKSQTFHNRQRVGDIMARANDDVRQLNPMMNPGAALLIESMMGIVAPVTFIAFMRWELLLAPLLWTFWPMAFGIAHPLSGLVPAPMIAAALGLLIVAELLSLGIGLAAVSASGRRFLVVWIPMMILYFPLGVIAAYKAAFELCFCPFFWDKTPHGQAGAECETAPVSAARACRHPVSDGS